MPSTHCPATPVVTVDRDNIPPGDANPPAPCVTHFLSADPLQRPGAAKLSCGWTVVTEPTVGFDRMISVNLPAEGFRIRS